MIPLHRGSREDEHSREGCAVRSWASSDVRDSRHVGYNKEGFPFGFFSWTRFRNSTSNRTVLVIRWFKFIPPRSALIFHFAFAFFIIISLAGGTTRTFSEADSRGRGRA